MSATVDSPATPGLEIPQRALRLFAAYRVVIGVILLAAYFFALNRFWWERYDSALYLKFALGYLAFGLASVSLAFTYPRLLARYLTLQVLTDIGFIIALMAAAGGVRSGIGLLLVMTIAAAALISNGRLALFFAAVASIALLLSQSWQMLAWDERIDDYSHAVMLCLSCFATAWLAYSFAKRMRQSEALASQRGIDLENLEQVNQIIIRDMLDGILVVDQEMRLRHRNPQAAALLGTLVYQPKATQLPEFAPQVAEALQQWLLSGREFRAKVVQAAGEGKELRLRFMPVGSDARLGTVIFIENWSRVQSQAKQLKLAALGRLTANIAHEIRNPLSAVSHANQLLQEDNQLDYTARRLLEIIGDNVTRLDQIVQDVLLLNRRDRVQTEQIALDSFLRDFREQFCRSEHVPTEGLSIKIEAPAATTRFDRSHLHQVLWNLCRNGWRHGRQQAASLSIQVPAQIQQAAACVIEVVDDGPGIEEDNLPHLFEPFFTTESQGTGLGLYIARELCDANNARLEYTGSRAGARFTLTIGEQND